MWDSGKSGQSATPPNDHQEPGEPIKSQTASRLRVRHVVAHVRMGLNWSSAQVI